MKFQVKVAHQTIIKNNTQQLCEECLSVCVHAFVRGMHTLIVSPALLLCESQISQIDQ